MKCYTHTDMDALAICVHCGRGLCVRCVVSTPSGKSACSPSCAAAVARMDQLIAGTSTRMARSLSGASYLLCVIAAVFAISAVVFGLQWGEWTLSGFVLACALVFAFASVSLRRLARRHAEQRTAEPAAPADERRASDGRNR